jgi:uncharacterized membrane protein
MKTATSSASAGQFDDLRERAHAPAATDNGRFLGRIPSIDIVRGIVMVLMAVDHVRVYSAVPAGGPTPGVFFTRWITNFCAPIFFFLAGTGAYLYASKIRDTRAVARWLAVRGVWLVLLELTFLRFAWTFNFDYSHYMLAGVIWSLGICMILMAGLVFLPVRAIGAIGVAIIVLHNAVFPALLHATPDLLTGGGAWLWKIIYFGGAIQPRGEDGLTFIVLYSIIPWIGVMAAGYTFGAIMRLAPGERRRICLTLGSVCVSAFLILRGLDLYGDPRPWNAPRPAATSSNATTAQQTATPNGNISQPNPSAAQGQTSTASSGTPTGQVAARPRAPAVLRFLNTSKYPASLLFLLMTLGPMFLLLPLLENARGRFAEVLSVFGRVPLFYYLLHIPVIHATALLVALLRGGNGAGWLFGNHPVMIGEAPDGYMWSLALLYLVTAIVVALLYLPCRWFARQRAARPGSWLRYL